MVLGMLSLSLFVLVQQQRGCEVSSESWTVALQHAETLVVLAEKKLQRQREAYGRRIANLEVLFVLYLIAYRIFQSMFETEKQRRM